MRPIELSLKSFTSFRDEQTIDFTGLDLFALTGQTGAGKSSILDAVTYALFGYVDRVGNQTSQLVSQGQPRMSVSFSFTVGDKRYRVARSTTAGGQTKMLLEKEDGAGEWQPHGDGADLVRQANKHIIELIGLDYDAFTRSVVLPQGRFAEFLKGDAPKRREILTDLLGLELFERMARRAGDVAREAKLLAESHRNLLETEYAEVDDDALETARSRASDAAALATKAQELERKLDDLSARADKERRTIEALQGCVLEVDELCGSLSARAEELEGHEGALHTATERLKRAEGAAQEAAARLEGATKQRGEAEDRWGTPQVVAALIEKVRQRDALAREAEAAVEARDEARQRHGYARRDGDEAAALLERVELGRREAIAALEHHERAHEEAHRKDLVGALVTGLDAGAPCPVCERPLEALPEVEPEALEAARAALDDARRAREAADEQHRRASERAAVARLELTQACKEIERCERDVKSRAERMEPLAAAIDLAFAHDVPDDPLAELEQRLEALGDLRGAEEAARKACDAATKQLVEEQRRTEGVGAQVAAAREAISALRLGATVERVRKAWPEGAVPEPLPSPLPEGAAELGEVTERALERLQRLGHDLRARIEEREETVATLERAAADAVPAGFEVPPGGPSEMLAAARGVAQQALLAAQRAADEAQELARRLSMRRTLEAKVAEHQREHGLYTDLGRELRQDRIVDYLQAEALRMLAVAGTRHLSYLSSTRYRLAFEDDRFFVIDAWNGEERRRVDTLSGGETFLASLALALALSEEVQSLSVTRKHRLESLFLDEGFGSLDPETLEVVVSAIEQLGGDGRMVGIITHVSEVAERMPVRLIVEKSPRGSRVETQTGAELPP